MAKFGKQRFSEVYQSLVGMKTNSEGLKNLHKNSKELVDILKKNSNIDKDAKIFELGAGPGRNLHYILEAFGCKNLFCNDLYRRGSFKFMSPQVQKVVTFFEGDSKEVIDNNIVQKLNLFISSDHLMHLEYDKADYIIDKITEFWKPEHILLRELKKEFEKVDHPRLYHNYDKFLNYYDLVYETSSLQDNAYFIWLLKRKNND